MNWRVGWCSTIIICGSKKGTQRQINIFQLEDIKPPVGLIVYFISSNKVIKAIVISHDASFAGYEKKVF